MADPGKGPGRLGPRKKMFGDPPPYLKVWIRHWIIPSNSHALCVSLLGSLRQMMQHFLVAKCKRRNEFAEWHVAWLAERYNYAEYKICKMAQRNKFY